MWLCSCRQCSPPHTSSFPLEFLVVRAPQTIRQRASVATWLPTKLEASVREYHRWRDMSLQSELTSDGTQKRRRPQSGTSNVTKWQATYRPLTTCCSRWIRLRLASITDCWTYVSVIDSCLAKSSSLPADGRSGSCGWIDLEKKLLRKRSRSHCSHVPDPVPPLQPSSMEWCVDLPPELQTHRNIATICVAVGRASVESQHRRACVWKCLEMSPAPLQSPWQIRACSAVGMAAPILWRSRPLAGGRSCVLHTVLLPQCQSCQQ